jgi:hypothetical protein
LAAARIRERAGVADIFQEVDEEVRKDRYQLLWQRYGRYVILLVIVIVGGTAASVAWNEYQQSQRIDAGERFMAATELAKSGDTEAARAAFQELVADATGGYHMLAGMKAAEMLLEQGDAAGAAAELRAVADTADDPLLAQIARLKAISLEIDLGKTDGLAAELDGLAGDDAPFRYNARELQGLAAMKSGEAAQAREIFAALADDQAAPGSLRQRARALASRLEGDAS